MDKNTRIEFEKIAVRKGYVLQWKEEGDVWDEEGIVCLEDAEDADADFLYFKTEVGLRTFLDGMPDATSKWVDKSID